jgi:Alpha/beta-hydrolase family N-terminus
VAPVLEAKTGSKASLIAWEKLGRRGRVFISSGPSAARIQAFTGKAAVDPIRVYVGLPAAETPDERARLALAELKRVGAIHPSDDRRGERGGVRPQRPWAAAISTGSPADNKVAYTRTYAAPAAGYPVVTSSSARATSSLVTVQ